MSLSQLQKPLLLALWLRIVYHLDSISVLVYRMMLSFDFDLSSLMSIQ